MIRVALVLALPLVALASPVADAPPQWELGEVPPRFADAVRRGDAAAQALQRKLSSRLMEAMKQGGPARAVNVCREEAARLADEAGREAGASVGRTSDRLRNPKNAPPSWAATFVAGAGGKRASEVRPVVFDLGERVGMLRPIAVAKPCLTCHGPPATVSADVTAVLRTEYPADRAIGYAEGDHRGFVWVVVPR